MLAVLKRLWSALAALKHRTSLQNTVLPDLK
jgi:hypothetical protein